MPKIMQGGYYNKELKEAFLVQYNKKSYETYFNKTSFAEIELGKDLSEFELTEFEIMFSQWGIVGISQTRTFFDDYIKYVKKDFSLSPLDKGNICKKFKTLKNWENQFKKKVNFLSKNELLDIENSDIDRQYAVIFRLIFEGLTPQEILSLTIDDVESNCIKINKNRELIIDELCYKLIVDAYNQEYYKSTHFKAKHYSKEGRKIIKKGDREKHSEQTAFLNYRVTETLKSLGLKKITISDIKRSGMLFKEKDWFENNPNKERLSTAELNIISSKFGYSDKTNNSRYLDVLTRENVNLIYRKEENTKNIDKNFYQFPFWKIQEENGELGEKIVKREMEKMGFNIFYQIASVGYDFIAKLKNDIRKIEVKTITNKKGRIYMSINEIKTAFEIDDYRLYILLLTDKDKAEGQCFEIINPMNFFGIKEHRINQLLAENDLNIPVRINSIEIRLNEPILGNINKIF